MSRKYLWHDNGRDECYSCGKRIASIFCNACERTFCGRHYGEHKGGKWGCVGNEGKKTKKPLTV